jgi:uncharacterized membrane-anchored protein
MRRLALVFCCLSLVAAAWSESAGEGPAPKPPHPLQWQTGKVTLGKNLAVADLPDGYRYLQQADARYVVETLMHNPPDPDVIGLISRVGGEDDGGYVAVVSYEDHDGHVKDDDAASTDYDKLLQQLKDGAEEAAPERRKQGYDGYAITGWAEAPHYDGATHKMYWAQKARFDNQKEDTLNYNVRLLGARGVLVINALGEVKELKQVAEGSKTVLAKTEFTSGNRYEDFKPGYDKVAAYGVGGLIAAGVLAKMGFFGIIGKFLIAAIKPIIFGLVVLGGAIAKVFGRGKKKDARDTAA